MPADCIPRRDALALLGLCAGAPLVEACTSMPHAASPLPPASPLPGGLAVRGTRLVRDGRPFFASGLNYWAGPVLSRDAGATGWDRARRDLDQIQALGVDVVRTLGATEGPDTEPLRIVPAIQTSARRYDGAGLAGIVRFAEELRRRGMFGIFVLNNFWPWSGGMAQYVSWAGGGPIPYPPPQPGGSFESYTSFAARFYESDRARETYGAYVRTLVPELATNPAVVWELANEPRGMTHVEAYRHWIDSSARLIKALAPGQLVTTGSEGETAAPELAGLDVVKDHASPAIDFITCHVWAQNWGWVAAETLPADFANGLALAERYIRRHADLAKTAGKPLLLEEFGFPRDEASFDPRAPTTLRDRYFEAIYELVATLIPASPLAGILPWAWSGAARPPRPGGMWRPGDPLVGDPPHEPQGWYGIYDVDPTTHVVRAGSTRLAALASRVT